MESQQNLPNSIIFGTGEYTTGFVEGQGSKSDKKCGVVGLVHFDLRFRNLIGQKIIFCGTNGTKFEALEQMKPGDIASVFTPDNSHYDITMAALQKGLHVMVTKPIVKNLEEHKKLVEVANQKNLLLQIEVHKRFDPIYNDARERMNKELGEFGYFYSYMSQPKFQLETFRAWAGKSSDISYYLNSHHVDLHVWSMQNIAIPVSVVAMGSTGQGEKILERKMEDTITLTVQWENIQSKNLGTAVYTASWTDPKSDVHSQQHFYYQGHKGFIEADQAHRGYKVSTDDVGLKYVNPLYMKYTKSPTGNFSGQSGYGYKSFEYFVEAAKDINNCKQKASYFNEILPTGSSTLQVTAILEAGRLSLDNQNKMVKILYDSNGQVDKLQII